jgi:PadR family transcriptional regulator PadR
MSAKQMNLLQGTLDLLILKALGAGELHGLGISRRIEQITHGTFLVKPGSLFPALHRMEEAGWLSSFWGESENNRRAKFYLLTKAGKGQFTVEKEEWAKVALAMANALRG